MSNASVANVPPGQAAEASSPADASAFVKEEAVESSLVAAQTLWGRGNLSPLDHMLGTAVVANLVPKGELAFIGHHLGFRMHRYAEDTGVWIDAIEAEPALSHVHKKKQAKIKLYRWNGAAEALKKNRYPTCAVFHASAFAASLDELYGKCAAALKTKGTFFVGDVMWTAKPGKDIPLPGGRVLRSLDDHKSTLTRAGLIVERTIDMSDNLKASIYAGLAHSAKDLAEWRALPKRVKDQRKAALMEQLELWGTICAMIQHKVLCVTGLIGSKQPGASGTA